MARTRGVVIPRNKFLSGLAAAGEWEDLPFDAASYGGQGDFFVWAVTKEQVLQNRFSRFGNTVTWSGLIVDSTVSGTPGTQITMVAPTKVKSYATGNARVQQNTTAPVLGIIAVSPPNKDVAASLDGFTAICLPSSAAFELGTMTLYWTITYEAEP